MYSFGNDESKLGDYAWYRIDEPHEVGKKRPNLWELYDMHGNVREWVQDTWHKNYDNAPNDGSAWETGYNSARVIRGCCISDVDFMCRSAFRDKRSGSEWWIGFRLLRDL
jgi:formylglycine-generating enzyme required for sulfatase activity